MVHLKHPGLHNCLNMADRDTAGCGFPVALGVKVAKPEGKVFLVSETGLFKKHHREFQTQPRYRLAASTFLFQSEKERPQEEADFHLPAKSLGVSSRVVTDPEEEMTDNMIAEALSSKTGALLDVSSF